MPDYPTKLSFNDTYGYVDYSAWIEINHLPVPIYSITTSPDGKKVTGYIEAKEGQAFTIHSEGSSVIGCAIRPYGDGEAWGSGCAIDPETHYSGRYSTRFTGFQETATSEKEFLFAPLRLTDDVDLSTTDENFVKNLGSIQLRIVRATGFAPSNFVFTGQATIGEKMVHEKTKKALVSHQAGLGASKPYQDRSRIHVNFVDDYANPYRTFEFRYLSRALLEIKGHIPEEEHQPNPNPVASTSSQKQKPNPGEDTKPKVSRKSEVIELDLSDDDEDAAGPSSKRIKFEKQKVKTREKKDENGKVTIYIDSDSD